MEALNKTVKYYLRPIYDRIAQLYHGSSTRTLQVTGVLGLAILLLSLLRRRGTDRRKHSSRAQPPDITFNRRHGAETGPSGSASSSRHGQQPHAKGQHEDAGEGSAVQSSLHWAVQSKLGGIRAITISAPGVLLKEATASELQESATLLADAAQLLQEIARNAAVYIITLVEDDLGEALCRGAFEASGVIGKGSGQIPPQRLLFCSTLDGKPSIVRQIEPQLHIDGHAKTIEDLKRFLRLLHVHQPGQEPAGKGSANVSSALSLQQFFAL